MGHGENKTFPAWTTVEVDVEFAFDLERYPLEIETDSVTGSWQRVKVYFFSEDGGMNRLSGGIDLQFTDPIQFWVDACAEDWITFTDAPEEQDKTWTITETGNSVIVSCNGVQMEYQFAESNRDNCVSYWNGDTVKLEFQSIDTASDRFRESPGKFLIIIDLDISKTFKCFYNCYKA